MKRIRGVICLLALVSLANPVAAEEPAGVVPGTRVRVTAEKRLVGRLLAMDTESLTLEVVGSRESVRVPRSALTRLELSARPSRKGRGALVGAGVGFGVGAAGGLWLATKDNPYGFNEVCEEDDSGCKTVLTVGSAVLLGAVGAVIGLVAAPGEKWEPLAVDRFRMSIGPARGGGIGAAVSFGF